MRSSHILFVVERGRLSELLFLSRLQGGIFVLVGLVIVLFCSVSALSSSPFYFNPPFALTGASSFRSITSSIPTSSRSRHLHDDEGCLTLWAWGGGHISVVLFSPLLLEICARVYISKKEPVMAGCLCERFQEADVFHKYDGYFFFLFLSWSFCFSSDLVQAAYIQGLLDSALVGRIERKESILIRDWVLMERGLCFYLFTMVLILSNCGLFFCLYLFCILVEVVVAQPEDPSE